MQIFSDIELNAYSENFVIGYLHCDYIRFFSLRHLMATYG